MYKPLHPSSGFWQAVLLLILSGLQAAEAQSGGKEKQYPIPGNIMSVFQTSCVPCHGDKGGRLPTSKLKFTRWSAYGASKQIDKASQICTEVRKGKMPPRTAKDSHPERIPGKEQISLICSWADSLKTLKGKK